MWKKFKLKFEDKQMSYMNSSQAGQDIFTLSCLNGKKKGTFLDLGCGDPKIINNTYLLEKRFNWNGVSIDIDADCISKYANNRKCIALQEDCTKLDFNKIKTYYSSNHIDYLSLDLEPAEITLNCLKTIPFDELEFSVITFEHDFYRFGPNIREESRNILEKYGYIRLCSDVSVHVINNGVFLDNLIFEDWWINPKFVDYERVRILESDGLKWDKIVYSI
jgi:hypothetical protein